MLRENPVKESDVSKAVNGLCGDIEVLEGRVQLLITRLSSVITSTPKCPEAKTDKELPQCELAKAIRNASARINKIRSMVNDAIEDLQI